MYVAMILITLAAAGITLAKIKVVEAIEVESIHLFPNTTCGISNELSGHSRPLGSDFQAVEATCRFEHHVQRRWLSSRGLGLLPLTGRMYGYLPENCIAIMCYSEISSDHVLTTQYKSQKSQFDFVKSKERYPFTLVKTLTMHQIKSKR